MSAYVSQYRVAGEQRIRACRAPMDTDDKRVRRALQAMHNRDVDSTTNYTHRVAARRTYTAY